MAWDIKSIGTTAISYAGTALGYASSAIGLDKITPILPNPLAKVGLDPYSVAGDPLANRSYQRTWFQDLMDSPTRIGPYLLSTKSLPAVLMKAWEEPFWSTKGSSMPTYEPSTPYLSLGRHFLMGHIKDKTLISAESEQFLSEHSKTSGKLESTIKTFVANKIDKTTKLNSLSSPVTTEKEATSSVKKTLESLATEIRNTDAALQEMALKLNDPSVSPLTIPDGYAYLIKTYNNRIDETEAKIKELFTIPTPLAPLAENATEAQKTEHRQTTARNTEITTFQDNLCKTVGVDPNNLTEKQNLLQQYSDKTLAEYKETHNKEEITKQLNNQKEEAHTKLSALLLSAYFLEAQRRYNPTGYNIAMEKQVAEQSKPDGSTNLKAETLSSPKIEHFETIVTKTGHTITQAADGTLSFQSSGPLSHAAAQGFAEEAATICKMKGKKTSSWSVSGDDNDPILAEHLYVELSRKGITPDITFNDKKWSPTPRAQQMLAEAQKVDKAYEETIKDNEKYQGGYSVHEKDKDTRHDIPGYREFVKDATQKLSGKPLPPEEELKSNTQTLTK